MRIDPECPDPKQVECAGNAVRGGGVVLYPADTIYGLGCSPFDLDALSRLATIKGRPEEKGFLVLVSSPVELETVARSIPSPALRLIEKCWPGPLTLLFDALPSLSPLLTGGQGKIGVRCPRGPFLSDWLQNLGTPLVSTSANRSGVPYSGELGLLRRLFEERVDLFLECGELPQRPPSTVVDVTATPFRMVRAGAESERIEPILRSLDQGS